MKRILLLIFISIYTAAIFDYDRAVGLAQQNEWALAGERFKQLIAADPDRPDMLYDAGVVAFNNEDFAQARTLFEAASEHETAPRALKERAYFNKANTLVKEQDLKQALGAYEQVLMLNPDNEQAKHNADVVKKLLEQQKNKQEDSSRNQKDEQNNQEQSQDQQPNAGDGQGDKGEQENREKSSRDARQRDAQQDADKQSGDEQREEEKESEQHQERQDKGLNQNRNEQNKKGNGPKEQKSEPGREQQGQGKSAANKQSQQNKEPQKREQIGHETSPDSSKQMMQQAQEQDKSEGEKEQDSAKAGMQATQLDPALERVLARREDRDAQLNKQIIKAHVGQTRDKYGNNW